MERKNAKLVKSFAQALKARRKAAGLSQEEFAHRLDLSVSYISLLETENRQPTLTVMVAVAGEFGISFAEFAAEMCKRHSEMSPDAQSRNVTTGADGSKA